MTAPDIDTRPMLRAEGLRKQFGSSGRRVVAVDDVSFTVAPARTTALVGESGSGKSTVLRLVMGLHRADAGSVELDGRPLFELSGRRLRRERARYQMVFQNPLLSFDPVYTIGDSIWEVMRLATPSPADRTEAIGALLESVGLERRFAGSKPRGMSGGELQRAAIARAISADPELVVLDEPTSALDVSIQAQVLELLAGLQRERQIAYLLATHDLPMVRRVSHDVLVLFRGRVVERASTTQLFAAPLHPYTRSLLAAGQANSDLAGSLTAPLADDDPCPLTGESCPSPQHVVEQQPGHLVACWRGYDGPGLAATLPLTVGGPTTEVSPP